MEKPTVLGSIGWTVLGIIVIALIITGSLGFLFWLDRELGPAGPIGVLGCLVFAYAVALVHVRRSQRP